MRTTIQSIRARVVFDSLGQPLREANVIRERAVRQGRDQGSLKTRRVHEKRRRLHAAPAFRIHDTAGGRRAMAHVGNRSPRPCCDCRPCAGYNRRR